MNLSSAEYNEEFSCSTINDPVRKFYVKSNKDLTPNSNYYFSLYISSGFITLTNKFTKVSVNHQDLYEIDFLARPFTFPFCCLHSDARSVRIVGFLFEPKMTGNVISKTFDFYTDIFYEKDTNFVPSQMFVKEIIYHDSELVEHIRKTSDYQMRKHFIDTYNGVADNLFRYVDGICGVAFSDFGVGPLVALF